MIGDMDRILRVLLLIGAVIYFIIIFFLLKKKKLTVRYSIIWLFSGFALILFAAVPYVIYVLGNILHVQMPVNLVFMLLFLFVLLLLLSFSIAVSEFSEKIKRLTQENALLEKRIRNLENACDTKKQS
ncbi:MAG: DUF2304 domain-containing protein [Oscillospiraceae bacterium]